LEPLELTKPYSGTAGATPQRCQIRLWRTRTGTTTCQSDLTPSRASGIIAGTNPCVFCPFSQWKIAGLTGTYPWNRLSNGSSGVLGSPTGAACHATGDRDCDDHSHLTALSPYGPLSHLVPSSLHSISSCTHVLFFLTFIALLLAYLAVRPRQQSWGFAGQGPCCVVCSSHFESEDELAPKTWTWGTIKLLIYFNDNSLANQWFLVRFVTLPGS